MHGGTWVMRACVRSSRSRPARLMVSPWRNPRWAEKVDIVPLVIGGRRGEIDGRKSQTGSGDDSVQPRGSLRSDIAPDRKSTRLNSSHSQISYAVFCLKKKKKKPE